MCRIPSYFLLILFGFKLTVEGSYKNIAIGKNVTACFNPVYTLNDGDRLTKDLQMPNCQLSGSRTAIVIELGDFHVVSYVLIFPGEGGRDNETLNNTVVEGRDSKRKAIQCSHSYKMINASRVRKFGLRMNCAIIKPVNRVFVMFNYVQLAEIEVYTFATTEGKPASLYRGCFKNLLGDSINIDSINISLCQYECKSGHNTSLMAISKHERRCKCGNDYGDEDEVDKAQCNDMCDNSEKTCGGNGVYSVYIVNYNLPRFSQCYALDNTEYFDIPTVTAVKCLKHCQYSIMARMLPNKCGCLNETIPIGRFQWCDFTCPGNDADDDDYICSGQTFVNYLTCRDQDRKYLPCEKLLRCKNNAYNKFGVCMEGCIRGFMGENCIEADQFINTREFTSVQSLSTRGFTSEQSLNTREFTSEQSLSTTEFTSEQSLSTTEFTSEQLLSTTGFTSEQSLSTTEFTSNHTKSFLPSSSIKQAAFHLFLFYSCTLLSKVS